MNLKKLFAGVLACCVMGGALPSVVMPADHAVMTASAADEYTEGTYESLTYINYGDYIEITGCDKSATSVVIPAKIEGLPVTSIGNSAFLNCIKLTSITIPDSVTNIGDSAFDGCESLTSITIPDIVTSIGNKAFAFCKGLTSITIPDSVTSIGAYAFRSCTGLTSITIPDNVTSISDGAFYYCSGLTEITIPNSVTSIGEHVFYKCTSLTEITIPDSVTSIGAYAFHNCTGLTEITIPNSVTSINDHTFMECTGLTSFTIPDGVTRIGDIAFMACAGLTKIIIPDSVTSIDRYAFDNCSNLTEITILNPNCEIADDSRTISNNVDNDDNNIGYFDGTIYGYENSTAQAYAEKYGRTFESLGEAPMEAPTVGQLNGDSAIDIEDAMICLQWATAIIAGNAPELTSAQIAAADIDGDGEITAVDALMIMIYYVNNDVAEKNLTWDDIRNKNF